MLRIFSRALVVLLSTLMLAGTAQAAAGDYLFDGGTAHQRAQVRQALNASAFDFRVVPKTIIVHIGDIGDSHARPGEVWLDARLLDAGRFSWAVVQDEFAHQVDFLLFDDAIRARLLRELGGRDWCYGLGGLRHDEYGCERFASTLVWAYWQSNDNSYRPRSKKDESAAMEPTRFRALMSELVGAPS